MEIELKGRQDPRFIFSKKIDLVNVKRSNYPDSVIA